MSTPPGQQDNQNAAHKSKRGGAWAAGGLVAAYVAVGVGLWKQEELVALAQAPAIAAVEAAATAAGVVAHERCAMPGTAARTYDVITGLYENRLIMGHAPYLAGGLSAVLNDLNAHKIAVQAATPVYAMGMDADAVFEKGADGSAGVLTLGNTARYNDMLKAYLAHLPAQATAMKQGERLVLHSTFAARSSDPDKNQVVKVAAGAADYQLTSARNPFPPGARYKVPVNKCAP